MEGNAKRLHATSMILSSMIAHVLADEEQLAPALLVSVPQK